ncbi:MAG: secondary thiamine-phosphate synthase enzyme YjbQ [Candidatus Bathyarchaeia archaeon]
MVVVNKILTLKSSGRRQLIDLTSEVTQFVRKSNVKDGICIISVPHATAAIIANEHETGLLDDLLRKIETLFPESASYYHNAIDDNADAHIASAFLGHSRTFPIINRELIRGTWQNIFLVELDGPRSRRDVVLQAIGDG